jgi:hypothetical protein
MNSGEVWPVRRTDPAPPTFLFSSTASNAESSIDSFLLLLPSMIFHSKLPSKIPSVSLSFFYETSMTGYQLHFSKTDGGISCSLKTVNFPASVLNP